MFKETSCKYLKQKYTYINNQPKFNIINYQMFAQITCFIKYKIYISINIQIKHTKFDIQYLISLI